MPIDQDFSFARRKFRERYKSAAIACAALKGRSPLAKQTIYNLFDTNKLDDQFTRPTQHTVIDLIHPNQSVRLYSQVNEIIEATHDEVEGLAKYTGYYKYYRKDSYGRIISGYIEIYHHAGSFNFRHWTVGKPEKGAIKSKPRHEGFVFRQGDRIHLLGLGPRYIRPAVTHVCEDLSVHELHGFVITVSPVARGAHLFASRFVMIHESNPKYVETKFDIDEILADSSKEAGLLTL